MSTDIHPHVEIKVNGKWEHYSRPHHFEQQNYSLFGKMAGVRDKTEDPICPPKGFPADASLVTRIDYEHYPEDNYCPSWFNLDELKQLDEWYNRQGYRSHLNRDLEAIFGYLFGNSLTGLREHPHGYPPEIEDVRLVFWFDN